MVLMDKVGRKLLLLWSFFGMVNRSCKSFFFVEAALSYKMERLVKNNIGKIIVIQRKRWKWALMLEW